MCVVHARVCNSRLRVCVYGGGVAHQPLPRLHHQAHASVAEQFASLIPPLFVAPVSSLSAPSPTAVRAHCCASYSSWYVCVCVCVCLCVCASPPPPLSLAVAVVWRSRRACQATSRGATTTPPSYQK